MVIGTEVPLPLLVAIAELPEVVLHRSLAHLQAAEFLYETRVRPDHEYTFKHALTHEVAYGSLRQVAANHFLSEVYLHALSDYRRAAEVCRKSVETLHSAPLQEHFGTASIQSVLSRAYLALGLAELGAFAEARAHGEDALRLAAAAEHPFSLAWAWIGVGYLSLRQGALPRPYVYSNKVWRSARPCTSRSRCVDAMRSWAQRIPYPGGFPRRCHCWSAR